MIACLSPAESNFEVSDSKTLVYLNVLILNNSDIRRGFLVSQESMSTLKYAHTTKSVSNRSVSLDLTNPAAHCRVDCGIFFGSDRTDQVTKGQA